MRQAFASIGVEISSTHYEPKLFHLHYKKIKFQLQMRECSQPLTTQKTAHISDCNCKEKKFALTPKINKKAANLK